MTTDPEVERIAYLMREAHHEVATAWLDTLTDSPPTPSECWAAVARAVIADRTAQRANPGTTHWEGCWDAGMEHYECLLVRLASAPPAPAPAECSHGRAHPSGPTITPGHDPQPAHGPTLMEAVRERDGAAAADLTDTLARVRAERDDARDLYTTAERQRCDALSQYEGAIRERDALRNALRGAVCWMDDDGCDCGVPADQPCALCVARVVLADAETREGMQEALAPAPAPSVAPAPTYDPRYVNPHACRVCGRAAEAHEPWCDIAPATPEPTLSPADVLSGAEEMLRRIAATACLDLDATEAGAIVAELDRLRGAAKKTQPRDKDEEQS